MIFLRIRGGDYQTLNPWGKIHVSVVKPCLICPSFLFLSNYHFNALQSSWGSYGWGVECGRTVSPFPHAHSTSRLTLTFWKNHHHHHSRRNPYSLHSHDYTILSILYLSSRRDSSMLNSHAQASFLFGLTQRAGSSVLHPRFSLVNKPFTFYVWMFFHTDFVDCVDVCFPYRLVCPCNFFLSFQCWDRGCCSSLDLWLLPFFSRFVGLLWSPLSFVCFGLPYILDLL